MTAVDFGLIAIVLFFLARGVWAGFARQFASIAGIVLGYVFAGRYYEQISPRLSSLVASPQLRFLLTYALLFFTVFLGAVILGFVLKKVMSFSLLGWFDRLLGGFFGLCKALVVTSVCYVVLSGILAPANPLLANSITAPYLARGSDFLLSLVADPALRQRLLPGGPALVPSQESIPGGQPVRAEPAKKTK